jgi:hypothetical protein
MRVWRMRKRITIDVSDTDRDTLTRLRGFDPEKPVFGPDAV